MVNSKELRLGNWLLHVLNNIFIEVNEVNEFDHHGKPTINRWDEEEWNPIPLTAEILEKCHIPKVKEGCMSPDIYEKKYTKRIVVDTFIFHFDGKEGYWLEGNTIVEVNYLHELQNLFTSLTGQELECNI